jgi:hypothetical protein
MLIFESEFTKHPSVKVRTTLLLGLLWRTGTLRKNLQYVLQLVIQ